jgi:hypothetical protein
MINRQQVLTAITLILLASGGQAASSYSDKLVRGNELKTCIAEISNHADYIDSTSILHLVTKMKRTRSGYVYTIGTSVFTDSAGTAAREYSSYCVARGDDELVKFRIREISAS